MKKTKKIIISIFKLEELKIRAKLRVLAIAVIFPTLVAISILFFLINNIYLENLSRHMNNETNLISEKYKTLELKTKIFTKLVSSDAKAIRGVQLKKMTLVINSLQLFAKELDVSFSAAYDSSGYSLGKSHKPKEFFKNESDEMFFKSGMEAKNNIDAKIFETNEGIILMSIAQIYSFYDETTINGIVTGGYVFDDKLAETLKGKNDVEILFVKNNILIGSTLKDVMDKNVKNQIDTKNNVFRMYYSNKEYEAKVIKSEVLNKSENLKIIVLLDFSKEKSMIRKSVIGIVISIIICLGITILLLFIISRKIENPIYNLEHVSKEIMEGNYEVRASVRGSDEIAVLGTSMNNMLDKILTMNTELEEKVKERTKELENLVEELKNTQKQLIESEKMAALGGLVAGVAHEINTPIGVCLTAASYMKDRTEEFDKEYRAERLSQEDLEEYLGTANDTTEIILKNIERAAELIHSFKQVAVDQTSEEKRLFNVKSYIETILQSLHPKWKKTKHKIVLTCGDNIEIISYPGALHQIISNLISNSLMHGFEGIERGEIILGIKEQKENVVLIYEDNGVGMSKENLARMYEPFFTTKRGHGGTGLGMNIVYNIVSRKLNGTISARSDHGKGIHFEIKIPKE